MLRQMAFYSYPQHFCFNQYPYGYWNTQRLRYAPVDNRSVVEITNDLRELSMNISRETQSLPTYRMSEEHKKQYEDLSVQLTTTYCVLRARLEEDMPKSKSQDTSTRRQRFIDDLYLHMNPLCHVSEYL